jgi:hypothetical protein
MESAEKTILRHCRAATGAVWGMREPSAMGRAKHGLKACIVIALDRSARFDPKRHPPELQWMSIPLVAAQGDTWEECLQDWQSRDFSTP